MVEKKESLSEFDIKSIHALVLKNTDNDNAGRYRDYNVLISGAIHKPVTALEVPMKMQEFVKWYDNEAQELHPVERAARVHVDFVGIHPFVDGNGRTSRLLMNLELMKSGYPPVIFKVEDRLEYYKALDLAHTIDNYELFMELTCKIVKESFEPYFYALGIR